MGRHKGSSIYDATQLFMTFVHCLWIYDYLLTVGDEISYAWPGRNSRLFWLFIAVRYTPVLYIIWVNVVLFHYSDPFCQETKWITIFHTTIVTVLAQIAVTLKIYAVSGRNKLLGGTLSVLISAQFVFGCYLIARFALNPMQPMPHIDLDPYKVCFWKAWPSGDLVFTVQIIAFDVIAFTIIFVTARRPGMRFPGIPSLLDTILRDATLYFVLIFAVQLCLLMFMLFAPAPIQLMPGVLNAILIPIMASRLMISLKKASVEPEGLWFLETMSNLSSRTTPLAEVGTMRFASHASAATARDTHTTAPNSLAYLNEGGGIELKSLPPFRN